MFSWDHVPIFLKYSTAPLKNNNTISADSTVSLCLLTKVFEPLLYIHEMHFRVKKAQVSMRRNTRAFVARIYKVSMKLSKGSILQYFLPS